MVKNSGKLETISVRGNKRLWEEFSFVVGIRKEKSIWDVLSRLIKRYLKEEN